MGSSLKLPWIRFIDPVTGDISKPWRDFLEGISPLSTSFAWTSIDFASSDLADILTGEHNDLQNLLWSVAGHIIDADLDLNTNDLLDGGTLNGTDAYLSNEARFYEGINYVGFTAPALAADQIWELPDADGLAGQLLGTDGAGSLTWDTNESDASWAFASPSGSTGSFYYGGFYKFHSTSFTPAGGTNVGTANSSYAAHSLIVLGAASTDMVVRVSGTSITDAGVRTAADTEDVDTSGGATNGYYETSKKWLGQVSYSLLSGTGVIIDAGFTKYWDNSNADFNITGFEATWWGGANDNGADIQLLHHKATGWTYSGGGGSPTHPTSIASMVGDHVTETDIVNNESGAWKRAGMSVPVNGSASEGTIIKVVTTSNKAFELGNLMLHMTPQ